MAKSILILMMLLLVLCSVSAVDDDDAALEAVFTESQDAVAVENIAAYDANSSTVDVASEHNDVFKASGDENVLDVSDDEDALKDSDNLKIRDSASGETGTVSSSSTTVTMDIYHQSMAMTSFYYIIDGNRDYNSVYQTGLFDQGGDWVPEALTYTFDSEGIHTIQLTTNGETTSNTITYVIGGSSDPQGPGEVSNPEAQTSPLPDYYIRFFDNDEDEFQNVQFLDGWDSLNVDMLTKLYAGDGSTTFPTSVYPGYASSTTVYGYLDGSQYSGSSYILKNGTSTSYLSNYQISFSNVGSGIHTFYSTYTYNGVTYYSNVYYFYVGDAYQEYETTLNLYDKNNPEGGASYKVGDTITILNSLTNSILGSDIGNYIFTRTSDGKDYVLENIDLTLNGEPLYQHGDGSLYTKNGEGLLVNPNGASSSGYTLTFDHEGWYNFTAKYYGNELGLKESTATLNLYVGSDSTPLQTSIVIELNSSSVSNNAAITVVPSVQDENGGAVEEGTVVFYNNETGDEIGRINLEDSQTFSFTASGDAGSHGIYAKYLGNDTLSESTSDVKPYKIKGIVVISIARVGDDVVIAPDTTVYFTVDAGGLTDGLALYIGDNELGDEDGSDTSIKFEFADIGENNVTLRFAGNDDYEAAVSNIVTIQVVQPIVTSISLELNTTELFNNDYILITPHVFDANDNEINVGNVTVYFDNAYFYSDPIAKIALGESANFTDDKFSAGRHYFYAKYSGASSGNVIYAASEAGEGKGTLFDELYRSTLELSVENDTVCTGGTVQFNLAGTYGNGELTFSNGDSFDAIILNLDTVGDYTFYVTYTRGTDYYASAVSNEVVIHVIAKKETINESDFSYSVEKGSVVVSLPSDATGNVSVVVGDETFTSEVNDGQAVVDVSVLGSGNYSMNISYTGDEKYDGISIDVGSVEVKVPVKINESDFSYSVEGSNVVVSLPSDATGNVTVTVNNKTFTAKVENGKAVVDLSSLGDGSYSMAISYSGDDKYDGISANATGMDVKNLAKLTGNNIKVFYDSGSYFKVLVYGVDGKVAGAGEKVSITLNGKKYNLKTDAKGYVKVKIALKSGSYKAVALYKGFKLTKKVTVKTVIKAKKTTKVKKSAKSLKLKIKLKGKKVLKKKSLKIRFKGKTYKLKTNKKGIAYFKVKKSVIKKLKKGKKYSFKISYKKDVLKRYLKVKK